MGQFEKIVVLTVLCVITVILVFSLSTHVSTAGDELAGPGAPAGLGAPAPAAFELAGAPQRAGAGDALPLGTARDPGRGGRDEFVFDEPAPPGGRSFADPSAGGDAGRVDPLGEDLAAAATGIGTIDPGGSLGPPARGERERARLLLATEVSDPAGLPAGAILRTTDDLDATPHSELFSYTWRAGDSFAAVAERLYGSASREALLRQANEGRRDIRPGEEIFVPVHDVTEKARPPRSSPEAPAAGAFLPPTPGTFTRAVPGGHEVHEVREGESLWAISQQHYGTGTRWSEIFEANQDRLRSPDSVQAGMRLRIP